MNPLVVRGVVPGGLQAPAMRESIIRQDTWGAATAIQGALRVAVQNRMSSKVQLALTKASEGCSGMALDTRTNLSALITRARDAVAREMTNPNDDGLKESIQCALEVIARIGAGKSKLPEVIPQTQFNAITCIKIPDEDRIGGIWDRVSYYLKMVWLHHLPLQWLWQRTILSDYDVFLMHKIAGNDAYREFLRTARKDRREEFFRANIIGNYEKALKRVQGALRVPVCFKEAQAYLLGNMPEEKFRNYIKYRDILFLEERSIRSLYNEISKDLQYMTNATRNATNAIYTVLEVLIEHQSEIADIAASRRGELDAYIKSFPKLKSIKEALRDLPEARCNPALLVEVGSLPVEVKDPEALAKTLRAYRNVIENIERLGQPWETTLLIRQQLEELEMLSMHFAEYQHLHQEVTVYEALEKLLRDIGSFKMDFDASGDDILSFTEEHPKVLVSIADQLDQLTKFKDLHEELQAFNEDLDVIRNAFLVRATGSERKGRSLLKFFEEIPAQHKEIAQEYLENLRLSHSNGEDYFLMAYKDYTFASRLFDVAIAQVEAKIAQFRKEFFEGLGDECFLVEDALLTEEERQTKRRREADFARLSEVVELRRKVREWQEENKWCEKGRERVFDAIKNNKNITERGTYFLTRYGVGADSVEVYYALGNRYYYNSKGVNIEPPEERYAKAADAYQQGMEEFLKFEPEEGKPLTEDEEVKRHRTFKQLQNGIEKASRMRRAAEYMSVARASIAACFSEEELDDQKQLSYLTKVKEALKKSVEHEETALVVGEDYKGETSTTAGKKRKETWLSARRKEAARVEASNLSVVYQWLGRVNNEVGQNTEAKDCYAKAQQRKDDGFRPKGDYTGEYALNLKGLLEGIQRARVAKARKDVGLKDVGLRDVEDEDQAERRRRLQADLLRNRRPWERPQSANQ